MEKIFYDLIFVIVNSEYEIYRMKNRNNMNMFIESIFKITIVK